jgi:hypothetical protein
MARGIVWAATATVAVTCVQFFSMGGTAQSFPPSIEIAFVTNAEAASVALVDVAARSVIATLDVNPAREKSEGPGAPNYAQDTDISPDGRTLYVSCRRCDSPAAIGPSADLPRQAATRAGYASPGEPSTRSVSVEFDP